MNDEKKSVDKFEMLGDIIEGDFSNMDGTETEAVRRLVFAVYRRGIEPAYHAEFDAMVDAHFRMRCRMAKD